MSEPTVRIQDDLYEAVNGEWLKTAVIPDDRPTIGGFATLSEEVEKIMKDKYNFWWTNIMLEREIEGGSLFLYSRFQTIENDIFIIL